MIVIDILNDAILGYKWSIEQKEVEIKEHELRLRNLTEAIAHYRNHIRDCNNAIDRLE